MTTLMIEVAAVWLFVILAGVPLFAAMGLASLAFVLLSGLPGQGNAAADLLGQCRRQIDDRVVAVAVVIGIGAVCVED